MRRLAGNAWKLVVLVLLLTGVARAQDVMSAQPNETQAVQPLPARKNPAAVHRFWDKQNIILFSGVGVARGLDYSSTLNMRRRGNDEWLLNNATVDNHAEFAAIEVATAAASVGLSAIWHYTGHHKLERWTSYVHIGVTIAGAGWNYSLKTVHPAM